VTTNRLVAAAFIMAGTMAWFWPRFGGLLFDPPDVTDGEGRIVGAILYVGAAILWFMQPPSK
jgi:hypothetical protein